MSHSSSVVLFSGLAAATIFAAAAAYGLQSPDQESGFDSNLPEFLKRSNSSVLEISRHNDDNGSAQHQDEYSIANSDPVLFQHLSAVNKAYDASSPETQMPKITVVVSSAQTRTIQREIAPELQDTNNPDFDVYGEDIEVGGRYYTLEIMIPK